MDAGDYLVARHKTRRREMPVLHIEHEISDLETWLAAFGRFEEARRGAGVLAQRVTHPADDDKYIVVELEFGTVEEAEKFKEFLENRIWSNPEASPALAGTPRARVLVEIETG
jgi:hypothetical protein